MKKIFVAIFLGAVIIFFAGCKKNKLAEDYYMTANVNGIAWQAGSINVFIRQAPQPEPDYIEGLLGEERIIVQVPVSGTASFREMNPTDILPAVLISFTATPYQSGHKINWETGTETNLDSFMIETSSDGTNWSEKASIDAHGAGAYEYIVTDLAAGQKIYYRLKMVDTDASFIYSSVIMVSGFFYAAYKPLGSNSLRMGYEGNINVTSLDQAKRTVTGTFNFKIKLPGGTVYTITNGRFGGRY